MAERTGDPNQQALKVKDNVQALDPDTGLFWPGVVASLDGDLVSVKWQGGGDASLHRNSVRLSEFCSNLYKPGGRGHTVLSKRGGCLLLSFLKKLQRGDPVVYVTPDSIVAVRTIITVYTNDPYRCVIETEKGRKFNYEHLDRFREELDEPADIDGDLELVESGSHKGKIVTEQPGAQPPSSLPAKTPVKPRATNGASKKRGRPTSSSSTSASKETTPTPPKRRQRSKETNTKASKKREKVTVQKNAAGVKGDRGVPRSYNIEENYQGELFVYDFKDVEDTVELSSVADNGIGKLKEYLRKREEKKQAESTPEQGAAASNLLSTPNHAPDQDSEASNPTSTPDLDADASGLTSTQDHSDQDAEASNPDHVPDQWTDPDLDHATEHPSRTPTPDPVPAPDLHVDCFQKRQRTVLAEVHNRSDPKESSEPEPSHQQRSAPSMQAGVELHPHVRGPASVPLQSLSPSHHRVTAEDNQQPAPTPNNLSGDSDPQVEFNEPFSYLQTHLCLTDQSFTDLGRSDVWDSTLQNEESSGCTSRCLGCSCDMVASLQLELDNQKEQMRRMEERLTKLERAQVLPGPPSSVSQTPHKSSGPTAAQIWQRLDILQRDENGKITKVAVKQGLKDDCMAMVGEGRPKVAKFLVISLFTTQERMDCNCNGKQGKPPLDPVRLEAVKEATFQLVPCSAGDRQQLWKDCVKKIDSANREVKRERNR